MGKRTKDKTKDEIRRKIQRLQKELSSREKSPSPFYCEDPEYDSYEEREEVEFEPQNKVMDSDDASIQGNITEQCLPAAEMETVISEISPPEDVPQGKPEDEENQIPQEVLAVLGEAKQTEETFGRNIPAEISERWGKILLEGLTKEHREKLLSSTLIPGNFQLAKAPRLNAEVTSVLNEQTKNRDRRLEKMQNQLGSGIAGLANLTAELISKEISKIDIIKHIAEINQILLDLHYEETMNRRRLIIPMLDKSFITIIQGVKREKYLFGDNLTENIKTTKSLERSSWQIKKTIQQSTLRRPSNMNAQGNVRAPPRQPSGQGAPRATHAPARYYPPPPPPAGRRAPPAAAARRGPPQQNRVQDRRGRR